VVVQRSGRKADNHNQASAPGNQTDFPAGIQDEAATIPVADSSSALLKEHQRISLLPQAARYTGPCLPREIIANENLLQDYGFISRGESLSDWQSPIGRKVPEKRAISSGAKSQQLIL
jgi:hypothetical protein